jgi:hypothetical protein
MTTITRFSQLSGPRQALVRLCQALNFGSVYSLDVRGGDPVLDSKPLVLYDLKLDADEGPRPEMAAGDFELSQEVRRLLVKLDELQDGWIERIEVRAGIPRRMAVEAFHKGARQ